MQLNPTHFWLTNVRYLEEKRCVVLQFSQLDLKRMIRLPFFPSFYTSPETADFQQLKEILSSSKKRFLLKNEGNTFKVSASNFSDLNILANLLFNETGFRPFVLGPERQFLLEIEPDQVLGALFAVLGRAALPSHELPQSFGIRFLAHFL